MKLENASPFLCLTLALCLAGAACTTKRHVRESVAPIQNQVSQLQQPVHTLKDRVDRLQQRIGDLDRQLAVTSEKVARARTGSDQAAEVASRAIGTAGKAAQRAAAASATAQQAQRSLIKTNQRIEELLHRPDTYRLMFNEKIYFPYSQSGLTQQERLKLDRAIRRLRELKNCVVEIEGFADSSGDGQANRTLSSRRADAVVHYLVVEHGLPLRSVWELGAGADFPGADNQTPNARRENRRVDVKVFSLTPEARIATGFSPNDASGQ